MIPDLKDLIKLILLAAFHFGGMYFAVVAWFPPLALHMAFITVMVAVVAYLFLLLTSSVDEGMPAGLLYLLPIIYIAAGIPWWLLRLLGLWPPK